jgi:N-acetylmuramoyl-L-alanine amidase
MHIIAFDAGHGFGSKTAGVMDPGATFTGKVRGVFRVWWEHTLAKGLVKRTGAALVAKYPGQVKVIYPTGRYTSRHAWAVAHGATRYISIHFNGNNVDGYEDFVHTNAGSVAKNLRGELHRRLTAVNGLKDRGLKSAGFAVLSGKLPAVLIETAGMNAKNLDIYQGRVQNHVDAIVAAIAAHLGLTGAPAPHDPAARTFKKVTLHIDARNEGAAAAAAKTLGAAAYSEDTTQDSWKSWLGKKLN